MIAFATYFLATNFQVRNQDVLFIANSPSVDVSKFLNYLNIMMNTANNGIFLGNNGIALYNSVKAVQGKATSGSSTVIVQQ